MAELKPKDFIKKVLIDEIGVLIENHPYLSFVLMGVGIEFLGKCLDQNTKDWHETGKSKLHFTKAINSIPTFSNYKNLLKPEDFYGAFRCGLAHAFAPEYNITLSSKDERQHLDSTGGRLNLKVEEFYNDFKLACEFVIKKTFSNNDKMNQDFLHFPDKEPMKESMNEDEKSPVIDPKKILTSDSGLTNKQRHNTP